VLAISAAVAGMSPSAQETTGNARTAQEKDTRRPELPFQIQLLETHIRFGANGNSRKEVHTIVRINNVLGAHQFARLAFDYNRAFQQVEIPMVRVSHANGGTSEILPSAVTDARNPAAEQFPAYSDVRVKSVRILGLQERDTIEYRVITTAKHPPLAPDFWLEHNFDGSGQVAEEIYEIELPALRIEKTSTEQSPAADSSLKPSVNHLTLKYSGDLPAPSVESRGEAGTGYTAFRWTVKGRGRETSGKTAADGASLASDLEVSTYGNWDDLSAGIFKLWGPQAGMTTPGVRAKADELTRGATNVQAKLGSLYDFVSTKIATVDLPLTSTGMAIRAPEDILSAGYGTAIDKAALLIALAHAEQIELEGMLVSGDSSQAPSGTDHPLGPVNPGVFDHVLVCAHGISPPLFLDPGMEVAPFGVVSADLRGKTAFRIRPLAMPSQDSLKVGRVWTVIPGSLPFHAMQNVMVEASVSHEGTLAAKVKYTMRGDNELLLRVAFHQSAKEKWKDVANLLALSDGFRGQVTSVRASDPLATKQPFTVEYELTQPRFVDWSKKPVRIPALLPQIGLPDAAGATAGQKAGKIDLGTPLEVQTSLTLRLPAGTQVQTPAGTSVARDYATFSSKYSATQNMVMASRHINFLKREIPADRGPDYDAFVHAVQNDQAQFLVLVSSK
jgi:Domain of Unknown Function with PDB structure (DUF3857)